MEKCVVKCVVKCVLKLSPNLCAKILSGPMASQTFACVSIRYRTHRGGVNGNTGSGLW